MSNNRIVLPGIALLLLTIQNACTADTTRTKMSGDSHTHGIYFPPAGQGLEVQDQRSPQQVGLNPEVISQLKGKASRWALWRHGYLVHVEGDFNKNQDVKSLRKTWHALTVGAAIKQGKIPSYDQKISQWVDLYDPDNPHRAVEGNPYHKDATWRHVMTQSAGFDYPYDGYPAYEPGQIWTYSDKNPRFLTDALAKTYGKKDHYDHYRDVVKQAYFDAIGMRGCDATGHHDGTRFHFDLEDMGRLGLLVMARGRWNGTELIPQWFVEELEAKQTYGMLVNYNGPDDGTIGWDPAVYPECPYGYMTWVNTDQDLYPCADAAWAYGAGAGGTYILWNHRNGIVFAGVGVETGPTSNGIPHIIERNITGPNPLVAKYLGNIGTFAKWAKTEIEMTGPDSQAAGSPNPFDIMVDVTFAGPSGQEYKVPGFYDGDGNGGMDGNVWKVRFAADELGSWRFQSSSPDDELDGYTGSFEVICPPSGTADFHKWGRLEYVGTPENKIRYLKFRDGPYWLKAGCDDPENFLGGFSNYDTPEERKAAIDYLAGRGVNSQYIMTHNIGGDDRDTWPWLGSSESQAKGNAGSSARFDIHRMQQWTQLFEYMQAKGVVVYLVLEDDSAWTGYDHERYYREIIARFGYLPALLFNFNEEYNENYNLSEALGFMQLLKDIDPYDHPRGIHNVNSVNNQYVDAPQVDFTSIQTSAGDPLQHNKMAIDWINRCISRNRRVLMAGFDEPRPERDRKNWWSAYIGGGVLEVHVDKPYDRPVSAWEPTWQQIGGARRFMESLEYWKMAPDNSLVVSGQAFCLANPGEQYALYLPDGGTVTVELAPNVTYDYSWWKATNDRNGSFQDEGVCAGGQRTFTAPGSSDWALRIARQARGMTFRESDGLVVIEAEHFADSNVRNDEIGVKWQVSTSTGGFVGAGYVDTPGPQSTIGMWDRATELTYRIQFFTAGTYNIWLRRYAADTQTNSAFVGLDGVQVGSIDEQVDYSTWAWKNLGTAGVDKGAHEFNLRRRDAQYKVDRFLLTTDTDYTPSDNGPEQSRLFITGDLDGNDYVDMMDFARFAAHWRNACCGACDGTDFTGDERVELDDLLEFVANWLVVGYRNL